MPYDCTFSANKIGAASTNTFIITVVLVNEVGIVLREFQLEPQLFDDDDDEPLIPSH